MLPPIALILPYYAIWIQFRLFDNLVALAFVYLAINLPLVIWLMLGYFRSIPVEIDEAARVDGCSLIGSFWYIALPVSKGGLTVAAILGFIYTWGELFFAYLLTAVNKTVPVALASFMVVGLDVRYGEMAAAGTLAAIPSLILTIIARNSLVSGFRSLAGLR
jgi:multiple sugar transport system permease protein